MLIVALLWLIIPALLGISIVARLQVIHEKILLGIVGTTLGITAFTTLVYVLTLGQPLTSLTPPFLLGIAAVATLGLFWPRQGRSSAWQHIRHLPLDTVALWLWISTGLLFTLIAPKLLLETESGLSTGILNAYGDVAWHLANITEFAAGQSVPPENPIFAGTKLLYPFLTNFQSAIMLAHGATFSESVSLVAWFMIPLLLTGIYCLTREATKGNRRAATLTMLLFLFGGATLGWLRFPADWHNSGTTWWEFMLHLPSRDYSGLGSDTEGFHFLNATSSLLLPQRSFLFALPLTISILTLLITERPRTARWHRLLAGILSGLLPLFHAHTVLAVFPCIVVYAFAERRVLKTSFTAWFKSWLWFIIPALLLGLPEIYYYTHGSAESGSFLRWGPGWLAGQENIFWYWFKNTGLLIPITLVGLILPAPSPSKLLATVGLGLFLFANVFLLAPWAWDNFKIFVYFFLFTLPLASWVALYTMTKTRQVYVGAIIVFLLGLHMVSGALDTWKIALPTASVWPVWDRESIEFSKAVAAATKPRDHIATAPTHNSAAVLAGRVRYLGYPGHVWSHGGRHELREAALQQFYAGRLMSLPGASVHYAIVGPQEKAAYPNLTIQPTWHLVTHVGQHYLYAIPQK